MLSVLKSLFTNITASKARELCMCIFETQGNKFIPSVQCCYSMCVQIWYSEILYFSANFEKNFHIVTYWGGLWNDKFSRNMSEPKIISWTLQHNFCALFDSQSFLLTSTLFTSSLPNARLFVQSVFVKYYLTLKLRTSIHSNNCAV